MDVKDHDDNGSGQVRLSLLSFPSLATQASLTKRKRKRNSMMRLMRKWVIWDDLVAK